jgi:hypothetical protein
VWRGKKMLSSWEKREDAVFMGRDGKKGKAADLLTFLLQNRTVIITIW